MNVEFKVVRTNKSTKLILSNTLTQKVIVEFDPITKSFKLITNQKEG